MVNVLHPNKSLIVMSRQSLKSNRRNKGINQVKSSNKRVNNSIDKKSILTLMITTPISMIIPPLSTNHLHIMITTTSSKNILIQVINKDHSMSQPISLARLTNPT